MYFLHQTFGNQKWLNLVEIKLNLAMVIMRRVINYASGVLRLICSLCLQTDLYLRIGQHFGLLNHAKRNNQCCRGR